jgi:hypothetical protein
MQIVAEVECGVGDALLWVTRMYPPWPVVQGPNRVRQRSWTATALAARDIDKCFLADKLDSSLDVRLQVSALSCCVWRCLTDRASFV